MGEGWERWLIKKHEETLGHNEYLHYLKFSDPSRLYNMSKLIKLYILNIYSGLGRSAGEGIGYPLQYSWASLVAQVVKNPPAMQETWV